MASLESVFYRPHRFHVIDGRPEWLPVADGKTIQNLPHLIFSDASPWREANLWALERATTKGVSIKTVVSNMTALLGYANWLEVTGTAWWDFPPKKKDRCLVRYRGALIKARDDGELAPSTASQRMAATIRFYRWLHASGLVSPEWPMWQERKLGIHLTDPTGFNRTITVNTTDLAISNRKAPGDRLEGGLLPVSLDDRDGLLSFAREHASEELFLMLTLGFFTGMRLGTLADLKIQTLDQAVRDPASPDLYRIAVGPGAATPVHTKGGVTGHIHITAVHLAVLREYFYSVRRLKRQALASPEYRNLVFLTRFGNPYVKFGEETSSAINVEMHALRARGVAHGLAVLRNFHFHQTRATFATEIARMAISICGPINAIAIVKEFLLHAREATSLLYIKFVQKTPAKEAVANAFTEAFLGVIAGRQATSDA